MDKPIAELNERTTGWRARSRLSRESADSDASRTFEEFVVEFEPRLRAALVASYGSELGREATADALAYAWEHWRDVQPMANPVGYLFRVGQSKARRRKTPVHFAPPDPDERHFEPGLPAALTRLSERQRLAVVLVIGFGWTLQEVGDLAGVKRTTVQNHVSRGVRRLRQLLGVDLEH